MFNTNDTITAQLPAIFVSDIIPLPCNEVRTEVNNNKCLSSLKLAEQYQNYIVLLIPEDPLQTKKDNNFYKIAVVAKIILNMTSPNGNRRLKLQTITRCNITRFVDSPASTYLVEFNTIPSLITDEDKADSIRRLIMKELSKDSLPDFENGYSVNTLKNQSLTNIEFSDIAANAIKMEYHLRLKYLLETDTTARLNMLLEDIHKQRYYHDLDDLIDNQVKESINASQKEYYLREKMKAIQNELGDKAKRESDIEEMRAAIKNAKMPENIEKKALDELNRYISIPGNAAESGIIKTYLDFLIALPWSNESVDENNIKIAKEELDRDHYGLDSVKDRILEYLSVKIMTGKNPQAILCLVGPPGVGKTSLARSLAGAMNKKFVKVALGGVKDEAEIRGHRRTYIGALPGRILQALKQVGTKNPVFLLDEIDKMSSDYKGDPTSAMLEVLDSEQNHFFTDHYLEEPFDLSKVFFVATANYLGNIPAPLRDRMEIVELSSYTEYEKFEIGKRHLLPKQLNMHGLIPNQFSISDQAIYKIIQDYTRESGVRELERYFGSVIRKAIKNILMNNLTSVHIDVDNLEEYIGKPKFTYSKVRDVDQVGVVTGLAYTQYGGDTLAVEVTHYPGVGKLVLTGQLGDVMKESAQAALSYVKSNSKKYNIEDNAFNAVDIHIHVPEGAIPKDGPSAGVTIAIGIISSFTNRLVDHTVGMTGEVTLRGSVLPIGGLREKSIAAHRSGLQTILIPADNIRDIDEIPESVKNSLKIIPVSSVEEIADYILR